MRYEDCYDEQDYDDDLIDGVGFSQPGSALRAATRENPRNLPCPNCGQENALTPMDRAHGKMLCCVSTSANHGRPRTQRLFGRVLTAWSTGPTS